MNKDTNMNNLCRPWSRKISQENYERKDERYGGQSEKFDIYIIGVSEGENK